MLQKKTLRYVTLRGVKTPMFLLLLQSLKKQYSKKSAIGDFAYPWQKNKIESWRKSNKKNQLSAM
jgi:hypothetical protein